ncbi:MAG: Aminotransferase, class [Chlorobi bacterium]|nr:Aminotransferase, class [Chlorobiota bacterium]
MIYLDNSATTPLAPEAIERMNRWRSMNFANASSAHRGGQNARVVLEESRDRLASALGAEPKEIIITSGGTEANNHALKGYALNYFATRKTWPAIITARTEHHAILHPAEFLARMGATIIHLDVDDEGRVAPETLRNALARANADAPLVTIMHANNETGVINPIPELATVAHAAGGIFHTDAVQTFGKLPIDVAAAGVDMLSISAHKIHGPKGIGALYVNRAMELEPLMHGGAQERNRRGGTEAVELAVGFEEATTLALQGLEENGARMRELGGLLRALLTQIGGIRFVTPERDAMPNIVNVTFADAGHLDGEGLIVGMDLLGVAVSNGSACTSGSIQPSHVLSAMGLPAEQAKAAVRFSLSRYTTEQEIRAGADALRRVVERMREAMPRAEGIAPLRGLKR